MPEALRVPHGLSEIVAAYGDVRMYVRPDGTLSPDWERHELDVADLPSPIPLSWDPMKGAKKVRCNRVLVPRVEKVFRAIYDAGLWGEIKEYGGCYAWRTQRGSTSKISLHAWGAAIDLNPSTNQLGKIPEMPLAIVMIFEDQGWLWGGHWDRPDGMHFQFATGY